MNLIYNLKRIQNQDLEKTKKGIIKVFSDQSDNNEYAKLLKEIGYKKDIEEKLASITSDDIFSFKRDLMQKEYYSYHGVLLLRTSVLKPDLYLKTVKDIAQKYFYNKKELKNCEYYAQTIKEIDKIIGLKPLDTEPIKFSVVSYFFSLMFIGGAAFFHQYESEIISYSLMLLGTTTTALGSDLLIKAPSAKDGLEETMKKANELLEITRQYDLKLN